jgi:hypothetical protein
MDRYTDAIVNNFASPFLGGLITYLSVSFLEKCIHIESTSFHSRRIEPFASFLVDNWKIISFPLESQRRDSDTEKVGHEYGKPSCGE